MSLSDDDALRDRIGQLMANGLKTKTDPFPENNIEFEKILRELKEIKQTSLEEKLVISGFIDKPHGEEEQRCLECMYYLVHRKWCDLPELAVPVEAEWWCRLWRI